MDSKEIKKKETLKEPVLKSTSEYLNCRNCSLIGFCNCPNHIGNCLKRFGILWVAYIFATTFILCFIFKMVYSFTQKLNITLLITLSFAFLFDLFCVFLERSYHKFWEQVEKNRVAKFEEELKTYKLMKEKEKSKPSVEIENIRNQEKLFYELYLSFRQIYEKHPSKLLKEIKSNSKKTAKKYQELAENITPESINRNTGLRHFLTIHLKEYLDISNQFVEDENSEQSAEEYLQLMQNVNHKIDFYIDFMIHSNSDLTTNISALNKIISTATDNKTETERRIDI